MLNIATVRIRYSPRYTPEPKGGDMMKITWKGDWCKMFFDILEEVIEEEKTTVEDVVLSDIGSSGHRQFSDEWG